MWIRFVLILGCTLVVACGGGDPESRGTGSATPVEVITGDLVAHARATLDGEADAGCIARLVVDALGVERLEQLGLDTAVEAVPELTVPPMVDAEGDRVYDAYDECLDFTAGDIEAFRADGLSEAAARCASDHYRGSPLPRTHHLLRNHDRVPHADLHRRVEALWNEARAVCRETR